MRGVERICGLLAAILGLGALFVVLTQHTEQIISVSSGGRIYSPDFNATQAQIFLTPCAAVVGGGLVAIGSWFDVRQRARSGAWPLLMPVGVALCVGAAWYAAADNLFVDLGLPASTKIAFAASMVVSLATILVPAAVAGLLALVFAVVRRIPGVRQPVRTLSS